MLDALRNLSTIVHLRRKQLGLSIRELAKKSNISSTYISSIEKGMNNNRNNPISPTIEIMVKLAHGLNLSLIEFITMSGFDKIYEKNIDVTTNTNINTDLFKFIKEDSNAEAFNLLMMLESHTKSEHLIKLMQSLNNLVTDAADINHENN